MKKILLIGGLFIICAFIQKNAEKVYRIELTETQINTLYQTLEISKRALPTSTIPMNIGVPTLGNIDSLEIILKKQYAAQQDSTSTKGTSSTK